MNLFDRHTRVCIFKCSSNLVTGHIELTRIILIEITGQGAKWALGGEGERTSCSRHNDAEPME